MEIVSTQVELDKFREGVRVDLCRVRWLVIDPNCGLKIRFEPNKLDRFYFCAKKEGRCIQRAIAPVNEMPLQEAKEAAYLMMGMFRRNEPIPTSLNFPPI